MPGSGLGLAIVKQVVLKHGGTLFVEDTIPGGQPPGTVDARGAARSTVGRRERTSHHDRDTRVVIAGRQRQVTGRT